MNIEQNLRKIANKVIKTELDKKKFTRGIGPMPGKLNTSTLIGQLLIVPACTFLSKATLSAVSCQPGVSPNFFWMLVNNRKFAILSMPNPVNGRAYIQYLNRKGQVCSGMIEIRNSLQPVCDYINQFNTENKKECRENK